MTGVHVSRRLRRWTGLVLSLFVVFLATSELEHPDIACHLKNPQHCTAFVDFKIAHVVNDEVAMLENSSSESTSTGAFLRENAVVPAKGLFPN